MDDLTRRTGLDHTEAEQLENASSETSESQTPGMPGVSFSSLPHDDDLERIAKSYADAPDSRESTEPGEPEDLDSRASVTAVKERIRNAANQGNSRPLSVLATREADLHAKSAHLSVLSNSIEGPPDPNLLRRQLIITSNIRGGSHSDKEGQKEVLQLYRSLDPQDPEDSILVRTMVMANNVAAACFERASLSGNPQAQAVNLRFGFKAMEVIHETIRLRDSRNRKPHAVVVEDVKVEFNDPPTVRKKSGARSITKAKD